MKTADGSAHSIVGPERANVTFNKQTQIATFYLVPTLNRELFLGIDFMRSFGCFAQIESLSTNGVELFDEAGIEEESKTHTSTTTGVTRGSSTVPQLFR